MVLISERLSLKTEASVIQYRFAVVVVGIVLNNYSYSYTAEIFKCLP